MPDRGQEPHVAQRVGVVAARGHDRHRVRDDEATDAKQTARRSADPGGERSAKRTRKSGPAEGEPREHLSAQPSPGMTLNDAEQEQRRAGREHHGPGRSGTPRRPEARLSTSLRLASSQPRVPIGAFAERPAASCLRRSAVRQAMARLRLPRRPRQSIALPHARGLRSGTRPARGRARTGSSGPRDRLDDSGRDEERQRGRCRAHLRGDGEEQD